MIKSGHKTIEGRLAKEKYTQLKQGDTICFNNELTVAVQAVRKYATFYELIAHEGADKVLPGSKRAPAPHLVYRDFYSEEEESAHGVVAIEIKLLT